MMKTMWNFCILIILIGLNSCEKEESKSPFYEANSCIELSINKAYVDSIIYFINCSDSTNVTYKWYFGDGTTSTERSPMHFYNKCGDYLVTLTTFVNNIKTDSSTLNVKVISGERYFDLLKITGGTDFAECLDSSILVLGFTWNNEESKRFIAKFDKTLRNKWVKYLNSEQSLSPVCIERLSDGNFIISGSFYDSNQNGKFALSKIDSGGNVIWANNYQQTKGFCNYATESTDGGIIAIGAEDYFHTSSGNTIEIVTVLKTDANGNFEWKKQFVEDWLMDAKNIISVNDGFIFASSTRAENGFLNGHDSLVIMKIGLDNRTIWKKSKEWQIAESAFSYNVWSSKVALNSRYIIAANEGNEFVMIFDVTGNYIKREYSDVRRNRFISKTAEDKFIIGGGETFWETINLNGFNNTGERIWSKSYGTRNKQCFPSLGYGSMVKPLLDGNLLFLGVSFRECMEHEESSMLLIKINDEGEIQ